MVCKQTFRQNDIWLSMFMGCFMEITLRAVESPLTNPSKWTRLLYHSSWQKIKKTPIYMIRAKIKLKLAVERLKALNDYSKVGATNRQRGNEKLSAEINSFTLSTSTTTWELLPAWSFAAASVGNQQIGNNSTGALITKLPVKRASANWPTTGAGQGTTPDKDADRERANPFTRLRRRGREGGVLAGGDKLLKSLNSLNELCTQWSVSIVYLEIVQSCCKGLELKQRRSPFWGSKREEFFRTGCGR